MRNLEQSRQYYLKNKDKWQARYMASIGGVRKNRNLSHMTKEEKREDFRRYINDYYIKNKDRLQKQRKEAWHKRKDSVKPK